MSLDQDNRCTGCDRPIHPNAGTYCVDCALAGVAQ